MDNHERRSLPAAVVRLVKTDKQTTLTGYAAKYGCRSLDLGGFVETIDPAAFSADLAASADIRALIDHDSAKVIGRTKAGTLRLESDPVGLRFFVDLPDTQAARDLAASVERGDVDGMSFGFSTRADAWKHPTDPGAPLERTLKDVALREISVVTFPAYPDTNVAVRSLQAYREASRPNYAAAELQLAQAELSLRY